MSKLVCVCATALILFTSVCDAVAQSLEYDVDLRTTPTQIGNDLISVRVLHAHAPNADDRALFFTITPVGGHPQTINDVELHDLQNFTDSLNQAFVLISNHGKQVNENGILGTTNVMMMQIPRVGHLEFFGHPSENSYELRMYDVGLTPYLSRKYTAAQLQQLDAFLLNCISFANALP